MAGIAIGGVLTGCIGCMFFFLFRSPPIPITGLKENGLVIFRQISSINVFKVHL
uniref:BMA-NSTP-1 n=1 Tax=Brugia malayi TaxID=6279 RepID=A0A0H5S4G6_BRUMA|nr:BMA-NSTP-1 [Brugia malayi]